MSNISSDVEAEDESIEMEVVEVQSRWKSVKFVKLHFINVFVKNL